MTARAGDGGSQPIRNKLITPRLNAGNAFGSTNGSTSTWDATAAAWRIKNVAGGTRDSGLGFSGLIQALEPGRWTLWADVEGVTDGVRLSVQNPAIVGINTSQSFTLAAGDRKSIAMPFTVIARGTPAAYILRETAAAASEFLVRRLMVIEGDYIGPYSDGDTPGWRWTGTPNASYSVGYPYTLESIAGAPLARITTPGTGVATGLGAQDSHTLYAVGSYSPVRPTASVSTPLANLHGGAANAVGGAGASALRFDLTPSGGSALLRFQEINGAIAFQYASGITNSAATPGQILGIAGGWDAAGAKNRTMLAGKNAYDNPYTRADGMNPDDRAFLAPVQTFNGATVTPLVMLAYRGLHDPATMDRILRWLANRYGFASVT